MIKLLIVAGSDTTKLAKYLEEKGSFSVEFQFESLAEQMDEVKNSIIRVDKMLYIYKEENSLRDDMQVLTELLEKDSFFSVGEIIFVQKKNEESKNALKYFTTAMDICKYTNYSAKEASGVLSFAEIYNMLLGVTKNADVKNKYTDIYRVEKGSAASVAFKSKSAELLVEPFNDDNLDKYISSKENAVKIDSGITYKDNADSETTKFDEPQFGQIDIPSMYDRHDLFVITGKANTGKTMWGAALAKSATVKGRKTLILDLTNNADIKDLLDAEHTFINYVSKSMIDLIHYKEDESLLSVFSLDENEMNVKLEFLQVMLKNFSKMNNDVTILICEPEDLDSIYQLVESKLTRLFVMMTPIQTGINFPLGIVEKYHDLVNTMVLLNSNLRLLNSMSYYSGEFIKDQLPDGVKLIEPITFADLDLDETLNDFLLEVDAI